ncbi:T9SS type A sorting domain-containing protein [bacterium]|nr:T9SS type A sorting domain-containing protein [bacterium]
MKKYITLLLLATGFLFQSAQAQIEIEKDSFTTVDQDFNAFDFSIKFKVVNNSSPNDTLFYWKRDANSNCGFDNAICDMNLCYPVETDSASFEMGVGDEATFFIYFYPAGNSGACCDLTLYLVSRTNGNNVDSAHFEGCTLASIFNPENKPLKVYPNPANSELKVETNLPNSYSVEIYDQTGHLVDLVPESFDNTAVDISDLPAGLYYIRAVGDSIFSGSFQKL